ncbi:hydrolase [Virgibacillus profundi]|uniref:Hydrolase n=1 Tax=Virgibacillus profundi TaxID=2024555 RepID=A0A2A2IHS6_9BACI|nr:metal-dependent hydrolase [Virgibacillus profundi]PAV30804.1 hydrolase [Virgibacillus profundi]PXY54987.1 metal-dependent hydrolase [Virgibacillus profundi]
MNGTAHAAVGGAAGFIVANTLQTSPSITICLVGLGAISALVPDLDIDGKLRGKITLSHKMLQTVAQLIGVLMIIYSFYEGTDAGKFLGAGVGLGIIIIASKLKQKHMLSLTGIGVLAGGSSLQESWLILFGIYILIASVVSHRSYTHSIIGVIFFALIASKLETSFGQDGIYYTCLIGYISHLVGDSKLLPFNKRGIKLFLPLSSKEV